MFVDILAHISLLEHFLSQVAAGEGRSWRRKSMFRKYYMKKIVFKETERKRTLTNKRVKK